MRNRDDERTGQEPTVEDLEVTEEEAEGVRWRPEPAEPARRADPIPYPNTREDQPVRSLYAAVKPS